MKLHRLLPPLVVAVLTLLFSTFVLISDRINAGYGRSRIQEHARILADDLWNFNSRGASEYLRLAAKSDRYESITVTSSNGEIFSEIHRPEVGRLERFLIKTRLIPRVDLMARIEYNGNIIGWIEAIWLPRLVFVHAYVLFAMLLIILASSLYARVLRAKADLELTVRERTRELRDANQQLIEEIGQHAIAEKALRESEEKHRLLAENINDVIWTTDLNLNYTYISPVSMKMHGWTREELASLTLKQSLTADSQRLARQLLEQHLDECVRTGDYSRKITTELELCNRDGSTMWGEITASLILDDNGIPIGLVGVTRDISERINVNRERTELQQQLERSRKMESLGLLAGGVAHDLNNVLSGIVSYPELVLMDLPHDSVLRKPIVTIRDSGLKAAAIVQDLLTLARRGVAHKTVLNLNELITEYLGSPERAQLDFYHPNNQIFTRLEDHLPNVEAAPAQIRKTLMNLVANSVEAQPDGGTITITTRSLYLDAPYQGFQLVNEGEYVVLSVRDQGEGIADKDLEHIFEPFYTRKIMGRSGTGLGLAVVWGTVEDHGGAIDVRSAPGHGTEFDLYLPMTRKPAKNAAEPLSFPSMEGQGERILIVDDIDYQREIATSLLQRLCYKTEAVASGEEAVSYLRQHEVDLVILDMIMDGGIDGLETFRRILQYRPGQKAIIVSGFSENERIREAQQLGAGEYLRKPYMLQRLGHAVRSALDLPAAPAEKPLQNTADNEN